MLGLLFGFPVACAASSAVIAMEAAIDAETAITEAKIAKRQADAERDFLVEANEDLVAPSPCHYCGTRSKGVHRCANCGGSR